MRIVLRWFTRLLVVSLVIVATTTGWIAWRFRASAPQVTGVVAVDGVSGPVTLARDRYGVPHVFGATDTDVFYGLGFAHAQDRLFQMDLVRRSVEGRLSEILGGAALRLDARARIKGYNEVADATVAALDDRERGILDAYAAGVNAVINGPSKKWPPEFALLLYAPETWDAADTASVWLYMADNLVAGAGSEFERVTLKNILSASQLEEFVRGYPDYGTVALDEADLGLAPTRGPAALEGEPAFDGADPVVGVETEPTPGSNNWVLSGDRTASGKPILANDPHLGLQTPSIWYFARLALTTGDVVGASIPGAPFVILGRNERIAWGFTNTEFDVVDYVPVARDSVASDVRTETIKVRFGGDVGVDVRQTARGPILDPAYFNLEAFGDADVILQTTADDHDNAIAGAALKLMTAANWREFVDAGRGWIAPMQNMVYADVDGNIGYTTAGRMPRRDAAGAWIGEIPYDALPRVLNPASGRVVTANNKIAPDSYPYPLPGDYAVYRARRITERLDASRLHDMFSTRRLQTDVTSDHAQRLFEALQRAQPETDYGRFLLSLLQDWDGTMAIDAAEPLVFSLWMKELHVSVYADELGEVFPSFFTSRRVFMDDVLNGSLSNWCDHVDTEIRETCAVTSGRALDNAARRLIEDFGDDPGAWAWGDAHPATFGHPLAAFGSWADKAFSVRVPHGGDGSTVNVGHFSYRSGDFESTFAASMRAIYDLEDLDGSLFVHAPGQSGHRMSPHYDDLAALWAAGEYITIRTDWSLELPPPEMRLLRLCPSSDRLCRTPREER